MGETIHSDGRKKREQKGKNSGTKVQELEKRINKLEKQVQELLDKNKELSDKNKELSDKIDSFR